MPAPVSTSSKAPGQKTIMRLYGAFVASLVLMFVPSVIMALVALLLFCAVLVAAYVIRSKAEEDSLTENHMTFLIRTIWIVCLFSVITVTIGGLYLWTQADVSAIEACAGPITDYIMANAENVIVTEVYRLTEPCVAPLIQANVFPLMMASAVTILPLVLYLILRLTRGIGRASKGYRIAHPKAWF